MAFHLAAAGWFHGRPPWRQARPVTIEAGRSIHALHPIAGAGRMNLPNPIGVMEMPSAELYARAERIYRDQLQADLERSHLNSFVAIEPESGAYFVGKTLSEASAAANAAHPDRRCCVLRVGHPVALHIGNWS